MFISGPFDYSDYSETEVNDMLSDFEDWGKDKREKGSRFTVVFAFCGVILLTMAFWELCLCAGSVVYAARACGLFCICCFNCVLLAAIITTGVFRFNTAGKLAAISLTPI